MPAHPWDRRPDEPADQYAQFLAYRNLGPSRTLARAYRLHRKGSGGAGQARKGPSGAFKETATVHQWKARAEAWDVARLLTYGGRVAPLYVAGVERIARRRPPAAGRLDPGDAGWKDVLDTLAAVGRELEVAKRAGAVGPTGPDPAAEAPK